MIDAAIGDRNHPRASRRILVTRACDKSRSIGRN